jgi:hypothetical protein
VDDRLVLNLHVLRSLLVSSESLLSGAFTLLWSGSPAAARGTLSQHVDGQSLNSLGLIHWTKGRHRVAGLRPQVSGVAHQSLSGPPSPRLLVEHSPFSFLGALLHVLFYLDNTSVTTGRSVATLCDLLVAPFDYTS